MKVGHIAFCVLMFLLTGLGGCDQPPTKLHESHYIFGTLVEIVVRDSDPERGEAAVRGVVALLRDRHREWHAWKPGGELHAVNQALAARRPIEISQDLKSLIEEAQELSRLTDGLFDPGIGALVAAWGFHDDEPPEGEEPPWGEIERLTKSGPSISDIRINGLTLTSLNPDVRLDFGAFAKGVALDRGIALLRSFGVEHAILNAGGDLNVIGQAEGRPWRIGIRHPVGFGVLGALEVGDGEAVYTSGNYERYREVDGIRHSHILDPRTGRPVRHIASATVVHESGGLADAAATALSVAGPEQWQTIAQALGLKLVLLVDEEGGVSQTPGMKSRFMPGNSSF